MSNVFCEDEDTGRIMWIGLGALCAGGALLSGIVYGVWRFVEAMSC